MIPGGRSDKPTNVARRIFGKSKWMHKYFGLILILFLCWMSLSGILLNHPDLIEDVSIPAWLVPKHYHPQNWNRSAMTTMVYSNTDSNLIFVGGRQGIWKSSDGGFNFIRFEKGYPSSPFLKKTRQLYWDEKTNLLFAACDGGLYYTDPHAENWRALLSGEPARKIIKVGKNLVLVSASHLYRINGMETGHLTLNRLSIKRAEPTRQITLIDLFFHLHDGRFWGLPGKLLFDLAGLVCFFLGLGAFYLWYFPSRWKRGRNRQKFSDAKTRGKIYRFLFKYHLKLGIWFALILLLIGGTGFFMRPPMLALIADGKITARLYPGSLPENHWQDKIINALYDHVTGQILIDATDGRWIASADLRQPFKPYKLNAPLFVMGATVFDTYGNGGYLIGSFNGLYHLERATGHAVDMIHGKIINEWSNVRPGDYMITGYYKTPQREKLISTHEKGLLKREGGLPLNGDRWQMPKQLSEEYRMPLWNYLFEIHNGRFFKGILGGLYILLVPLGSLLFVLITLSGIYDWFYLKLRNRRTVV